MNENQKHLDLVLNHLRIQRPWEQGYYAASFDVDECPYDPEANPDEYKRWWAGFHAWYAEKIYLHYEG